MDISNLLKFEYLLAVATFLLPGFIFIKIIKLKVPTKDFLLKDLIFEAFSYSLLNLAIFGWIPYLLLSNNKVNWAIFSFIIILTISPVLLSFLYIKIINSQFFINNFDIQVPTAWDWYFSKKPRSILLIHLKDGSDVVGFFGPNSYATSYPNDGSIYLEKVYTKNEDGKLKLVKNSNGVLIAKDQYISIEIYSIGENYE
jgi:hypothetical protein